MVPEKTPISAVTVEKPLVLVVDDEYGPRESIAFSLSSDFVVETASRAAEALRKLKEKPYGAVVLDIRMPEMDGIKALEEIRRIDPDLSVIMLTGYGTLHTAQQAMLAGANQYLRKPPDVAELQEAVRKQSAATRLRRLQTQMSRDTLAANVALKEEIANAEPHIWQSRASVELVHDLNNPLTVVIGYSAIMAEEARLLVSIDPLRAARFNEYASIVERAAEYCRHLSENWRQSARSQVDFALVDLVSIAREVQQVIFFGNSGIRFEGEPVVMVKGSKFELMRIFQNIFKNAFEAGAKSLTIAVTRINDTFEVIISDDGSGMTPEVLKKSLKGGFSNKTGGTGLGLSICRHLLGTYGATLALSSKMGKGTTIRIDFPVAKT